MLINSLLQYYGLSNFSGIEFQSFQFDCLNSDESTLDVIDLSDIKEYQEIVLFISIRATTILEQKTHPTAMLKRQFGLICDLLFERQIKTFEGTIRLCAVRVHRRQFHVLLKTLFGYSSYSFAFINNERVSSDFLSSLSYSFGEGLLTPKAITACANTVLNNSGSSFLHVLQGCDGFSVNYFFKK